MTGHGLGSIKEATGRILGRVSYEIEYQSERMDGDIHGRFVLLDRRGALQGKCLLEMEDECLLPIHITSNLFGPSLDGDLLSVHFFKNSMGEPA